MDDRVLVGLFLGGMVVAAIVLVAAVRYRRERRRKEEELVKLRTALVLGRARGGGGASRPTAVSQGKKPGTGDNFSIRHKTMPQHGTGNNYSNRHNTMPPQLPLPNAGSTPYSPVTGHFPATTFPGSQQSTTPTTIIPMTHIAPVPQQQHQTYQDQMQVLQFSSHPRPNYVTTAYSTEPATSSPAVSYPGSSGAPQAAWQPTPFVPPARPASSTRLPSPSAGSGVAGHSPGISIATALSSTTGTAPSQTNAIRDSQDRGTPSPSSPPPPSPPSVPRSTRPDQKAGSASSPHASLARSQNPQYVDDYHLH